jgi:hypothetical protein
METFVSLQTPLLLRTKEHNVKPKIDPSILGNAIKIKTKTQSKRGGKRNNRTKKCKK